MVGFLQEWDIPILCRCIDISQEYWNNYNWLIVVENIYIRTIYKTMKDFHIWLGICAPISPTPFRNLLNNNINIYIYIGWWFNMTISWLYILSIHFPSNCSNMAMDQYLYIPFLGGWTSIYQLFWCSPGVQGFDTLPHLRPSLTSSVGNFG